MLRGCCELPRGLDADDRRDAGGFKLAPGVAQECLHGGDVETATDLIRPGDRETFAGRREQAAAFELFLQRLAFGFRAFEDGVGLADRVGEGFAREIVESIIVLGSLGKSSASAKSQGCRREGGAR